MRSSKVRSISARQVRLRWLPLLHLHHLLPLLLLLSRVSSIALIIISSILCYVFVSVNDNLLAAAFVT